MCLHEERSPAKNEGFGFKVFRNEYGVYYAPIYHYRYVRGWNKCDGRPNIHTGFYIFENEGDAMDYAKTFRHFKAVVRKVEYKGAISEGLCIYKTYDWKVVESPTIRTTLLRIVEE